MGESSASDSATRKPVDVSSQRSSHLTKKLEEYFTAESISGHHFDDVECSSISSHLIANGCSTWATIPRIYIVLRLINQVHAIEDFVRLGLNDLCLPFNNTSNIPTSISLSVRQRFLETQSVVLTKSIIIERGLSDKKHVLFSKEEPFPYEELGRLGRGRSALVDQVKSPLSGGVFARKRFQRIRGIPRDTIRMFLNELQILKRIDHEHCVELVGSYTDPKFFGILISPVAESNLNDFMDVAEKQDDCRSMLSNFFGCLAGAVMYLHNNRIRHRDIKPENILIYQAKVYLTDFGISLDWEHLSRSTTTEDSGKTPLYCAPEVASQFAKRNSATDIWSLGCVFTEMLVVVRGYTKEELRTAFYKNSESRVFYRNSTVVHEWLNGRLLDSISVSSKSLTQITSTMLSLDHESRPKAHTVYDTLSSCPSNDSLNAITYCGECCQSIEATMSETHSDDDAWDPDLHEPVDKLHTTGSPPTRGQHGPLPEQMVTLSIEPPVLTTSTPTATHNLPLALQPLRDLPQPSKEQLLLSIKFSVWEPCTYNKKATFTLKSRDFAYPAHLVSCIKRKFAKASYLGNRVEATWTKQLRKEQPDLLEQIRSADESDVAPLLHLVLQSGLAVRPLSVVPWTGFQRVLATKFEEPRSRFRNAVLKLLILYGWTCQSPVFHTIRRGSVDDLAFVLAAGYNPNEEGIPLGGEMFDLADIDSRLRSPLFFAAHYGSLEKVQLLHESGVSHEPVIYPSGTDTALHHAVAGGNFEVVKFLYNTGNYKNTLMTPDSNGDTPISLARFEHQDLEIYQYLKLCRIREGYELAALQSR